MKKHSGFTVVEGLILLLVVAVVSFGAYYVWNQKSSNEDENTSTTSNSENDSIVSSQLPDSKYAGNYTLNDEQYGTMTTVELSSDTRTITTNALPNHDTGEFPNEGNPNTITEQDSVRTYPLNPTYTGIAADVREPGVAINGVKFEPGTAEVATCSSGESFSIEAIQDITDLGLDFNNAHVQPNGEYHYHGVSNLLVDIYDEGSDLVHIGFAADGHLMYYSKSGAYTSSYKLGTDQRTGTNCVYSIPGPSGGGTITFGPEKDGSLTDDWTYNADFGDLDECNGINIDGQYIYLLTNDFPYVPRCLKGEFTEAAPTGTPPQNQQLPPPRM